MIDSHVGIDIAKAKFDVAVLIPKSPIRYRTFPNSAKGFRDLTNWLEGELFAFEPHFCMEATGRYGENLAFFLHDSGSPVSVVNPSCVKNYARSKLRSRIEGTGKSKMVAIGAAMRKLVHIVFGVLKSGESFNNRLHLLEV